MVAVVAFFFLNPCFFSSFTYFRQPAGFFLSFFYQKCAIATTSSLCKPGTVGAGSEYVSHFSATFSPCHCQHRLEECICMCMTFGSLVVRVAKISHTMNLSWFPDGFRFIFRLSNPSETLRLWYVTEEERYSKHSASLFRCYLWPSVASGDINRSKWNRTNDESANHASALVCVCVIVLTVRNIGLGMERLAKQGSWQFLLHVLSLPILHKGHSSRSKFRAVSAEWALRCVPRCTFLERPACSGFCNVLGRSFFALLPLRTSHYGEYRSPNRKRVQECRKTFTNQARIPVDVLVPGLNDERV